VGNPESHLLFKTVNGRQAAWFPLLVLCKVQ
jgi:hypothetical protein